MHVVSHICYECFSPGVFNEIFARALFSRNFANAKFCEDEILAK